MYANLSIPLECQENLEYTRNFQIRTEWQNREPYFRIQAVTLSTSLFDRRTLTNSIRYHNDRSHYNIHKFTNIKTVVALARTSVSVNM